MERLAQCHVLVAAKRLSGARYRRRGIYRRLYQHVLDEAKSRKDICGVRLYVSKENVAAQRVYERLGLTRAHYEMYEIDFVLER